MVCMGLEPGVSGYQQTQTFFFFAWILVSIVPLYLYYYVFFLFSFPPIPRLSLFNQHNVNWKLTRVRFELWLPTTLDHYTSAVFSFVLSHSFSFPFLSLSLSLSFSLFLCSTNIRLSCRFMIDDFNSVYLSIISMISLKQ